MAPAARRRSVAVVGGGVAGLALASALDPSRFDVTIYEAAPERAAYGGALAVWPSARRALRQVGVDDAVAAEATPVGGGALHDLQGRALLSAQPPGLVMVPRGRLLAALDAAVPGTVRRVTTDVTDPSALDEDLVVGADGIRSRVRTLVHPRGAAAAERRASPFVALRGVTTVEPAPGTAGEYWGPGLLFGIVPTRGQTYFFTSHRSDLGPEPLDPSTVLAEARVRFAGTAPAITDVLEQAAADPRRVVATRLWTAPPIPRYVHGRYVVVGDAAHGMLPNLGRGACEAIVDAVTLARALERGDDLRGWQARRVTLTQAMRVTATAMMAGATSRRLTPARERVLGGAGRLAQRLP